jgi:hypothetical protein
VVFTISSFGDLITPSQDKCVSEPSQEPDFLPCMGEIF